MDRTEKIRALNDQLRMRGIGGQIVLTSGVSHLSRDELGELLNAIVAYDRFDEGDDPYAEHDFGSVVVRDAQFFWKIDYYDATLTFGSDDPSDPDRCRRIMTVMLASEY